MTKLDILVNRLNKIGVDITLTGSYPWVYVQTINQIYVTEKYMSEHGFVLGYQTNNGFIFEQDMKPFFRLVRKINNLNTF